MILTNAPHPHLSFLSGIDKGKISALTFNEPLPVGDNTLHISHKVDIHSEENKLRHYRIDFYSSSILIYKNWVLDFYIHTASSTDAIIHGNSSHITSYKIINTVLKHSTISTENFRRVYQQLPVQRQALLKEFFEKDTRPYRQIERPIAVTRCQASSITNPAESQRKPQNDISTVPAATVQAINLQRDKFLDTACKVKTHQSASISLLNKTPQSDKCVVAGKNRERRQHGEGVSGMLSVAAYDVNVGNQSSNVVDSPTTPSKSNNGKIDMLVC